MNRHEPQTSIRPIFAMLAGNYDALMLDMDGTSIRNEPLHADIGIGVLREMGVTVDQAWWFSHLGKGHAKVWEILHEAGHKLPVGKQEFTNICAGRYLAFINNVTADDKVHLIRPGLRELIDVFRQQGKPVSVVSGNEEPVVYANIEAIGIKHDLASVISNCRVKGVGRPGKPAPDCYQIACEAVGVQPLRALAIEDSYTGCRSAQAAGLPYIHIYYPQAGQTPDPDAILTIMDTQRLEDVLPPLVHNARRNIGVTKVIGAKRLAL